MVNHTIPVQARPDLRLEKSNLSSVCKLCHDTVIRQLEREADRLGDIGILALWLTDPARWPDYMAFEAVGKPRLLRDQDKASGHAKRQTNSLR